MPLDLQLLGKKLRLCREQFQLLVTEVCKNTGINEEQFKLYEAGQAAPTGDEILILADFYKCDYKYFISNEKLAAFEQTDFLFRRFGKEFSKNDRWAVQEFLFLSECESFLQKTLKRENIKEFSFVKRGGYFKEHGKMAAAELRTLFGYSKHAVPSDIYRDFRNLGFHIFRRKLENSNISGLYINHPVAGKCILINYSEDVYRQRFTGAHEAGHAILDDEKDIVVSLKADNQDLSEVRANTFASHYLMPPGYLRMIPDSAHWKPEKALEWAGKLKVSTEALSIALLQEGLINDQTAAAIKIVKVRKEDKRDPELPETLSPRFRHRKEELLKRGLSGYFVSLGFAGYQAGVVSAARLGEIFLLDGDAELRELAEMYNESIQYDE